MSKEDLYKLKLNFFLAMDIAGEITGKYQKGRLTMRIPNPKNNTIDTYIYLHKGEKEGGLGAEVEAMPYFSGFNVSSKEVGGGWEKREYALFQIPYVLIAKKSDAMEADDPILTHIRKTLAKYPNHPSFDIEKIVGQVEQAELDIARIIGQ